MKFSAQDPSLLGVLSQRNFLQVFKMDAGPSSHFMQRDFIKVSLESSFVMTWSWWCRNLISNRSSGLLPRLIGAIKAPSKESWPRHQLVRSFSSIPLVDTPSKAVHQRATRSRTASKSGLLTSAKNRDSATASLGIPSPKIWWQPATRRALRASRRAPCLCGTSTPKAQECVARTRSR